jgi:hypothetical protein
MTYDLRNAEKALPARVRKSIENNRSVLAWYARPTTATLSSRSLTKNIKSKQSVEKLWFQAVQKGPDARRARNRSFGFAQDKLGGGVLADTLERAMSATKQVGLFQQPVNFWP